MTPELIDALVGHLNFVRVSVDGVGATYEALRGRPFSQLLSALDRIGDAFKFGLNCVVNEMTLSDLDAIADLASTVGAAELLLLPEHAVRARSGCRSEVLGELHAWVGTYCGPVPLAIGQGELGPVAVARPLPHETGLRAYAHIDASANLRRNSYGANREKIDHRGVMAAARRLERRDAE
ncbi:hypothetical protein NJB14197_35500 [Mycobacterium montefiorense]|uniref:Uncharacterized protein n=2 Tax=Mycobacterium montefiorense TaxID=154654 RepID=A0AA37PJA4_9MYCO|nr:hypothetical protein MmonteBS_30510 [Mycobacterium montefiorense]GKU34507.1 hypothetical protein NJB14191_18530 [Mycobacterium montefiorense]GKU39128.1 hypothetical protein NJB14192_11240 [Mycobacterium montefiorense]GKU43553.1 hypothetical protein NJB14194_01860 [Mycobacterium montefiorense]GKU49893.1 hypothetical protein NJB14195_11390 [Mycobacterium montefiorense]